LSNDSISFRPTDDDLWVIKRLLSDYSHLRDNKHAAISFALTYTKQEMEKKKLKLDPPTPVE